NLELFYHRKGNCYSSSPEICTIILAGNLSASRPRLFAFLSLQRSSSKFFLLTCIHSSKRFFQWRHLLFTRKWMLMNLFLDVFQGLICKNHKDVD
ncbi:hypothetical protein LINGRAHAP2_LOCUS31437, partial [Linum grandiflorum]